MIGVSVVVPTCKRPRLLDRCLAALAAQDLETTHYEVLVVDDGRDEATCRVVEAWAARSCPPIHYLRPDGRGPAAARNAGWRRARGQIVAFTDDDCVPTPGWLREGLAAFHDGVVGVGGRIIVPLPPHPTDYERNIAGLERTPFVTANCFYRREALAAIGGFDERFTAPWREDSDLFFALIERGERLEPLEDAVVVHPVRPAPWGVSLREQRKTMFNALLYKKHPALYRERIRPRPLWRYYAIVLTLLLSLLGLGRGDRRLMAIGGLWLWLTGCFCADRLRGTSCAPAHVAEMIITSALIPPLSVFWRLVGAVRYRVLYL